MNRCSFLVLLVVLASCDGSSSGPSTGATSALDLGVPASSFAVADGVLAATFTENGDQVLRIVELDSRRSTTIPHVFPHQPLVGGGFVTYVVWEEGRDLNGDHDGSDFLLRVRDVIRRRTKDFRLAVENSIAQDGALIAFGVPEDLDDLDGNGTLGGEVVHVYDGTRDRLTRLPITAISNTLVVQGRRVLFQADERESGDLNGDGGTGGEVQQIYDADTGVLTNTARAVGFAAVDGDLLAMLVAERANGSVDLNDNGSTDDSLVELHDLATGSVSTTPQHDLLVYGVGGGLAILAGEGCWAYDLFSDTLSPLETMSGFGLDASGAHDRRFAYTVNEGTTGVDLDGDGELTHDVVHVFDARSGVSTNTRVAALANPSIGAREVVYLDYVSGSAPGPSTPTSIHLYGLGGRGARDLGLLASDFRLQDERVVVLTPEHWQGEDLNGNGGQGDIVLQVHDLRTGRTQNTGISYGDFNLPVGPVAIDGQRLVLEAGGRLVSVRLR